MLSCPNCGRDASRVVESRPVGGSEPRQFRRRECRDCKRRWNTWEVAEHELGHELPKPWAPHFRRIRRRHHI